MHQPHPGRRVGCWVCLGLWLIVLVGRLCYCLPDRVRPRSASGTRAPSEDASDLCTGLDPGGSVVDGLASGGVHHWRGLFRSFEGRTRRPPPGHPPSTPRSCPPKDECRSPSGAWRAGRRWTGVPRPGVEDRLVPPRRAPAGRHIDRLAHQGPVPRVVAPVA